MTEIELAVEDAHDRAIMTASTHALSHGAANGVLGEMNVRGVNVDLLKLILLHCVRKEIVIPKTRNSKRMISACSEILHLRQALLSRNLITYYSRNTNMYNTSPRRPASPLVSNNKTKTTDASNASNASNASPNWDLVSSITSSSIILKTEYPIFSVKEMLYAKNECDNVKLVTRFTTVLGDRNQKMKEYYTTTNQTVEWKEKELKEIQEIQEIQENKEEEEKKENKKNELREDLEHRPRYLFVSSASVVELETALKEYSANSSMDASKKMEKTIEANLVLFSATVIHQLRTSAMHNDWNTVADVINNVRSRNNEMHHQRMTNEEIISNDNSSTNGKNDDENFSSHNEYFENSCLHAIVVEEYVAIRNESDGRSCLSILAKAIVGDGRTKTKGGIGVKGRPGHLELDDLHRGITACDESIEVIHELNIPPGRDLVRKLYEAVQILRSLRACVLRGDWETAHDLVGEGVNPLLEKKAFLKRNKKESVTDSTTTATSASASSSSSLFTITTADSLVQVGFDALEKELLATKDVSIQSDAVSKCSCNYR